jgi:hypothetical protein
MRNQALKLFPFDRLPTKVAAPFRRSLDQREIVAYVVRRRRTPWSLLLLRLSWKDGLGVGAPGL